MFALNALTLGAVAALFARFLVHAARSAEPRQRMLLAIALLYFASFVVAPDVWIIHNPGERFLLPLFLLCLTGLVPRAQAAADAPARACRQAALGALLLCAQALYLHLYAGAVSASLARAHEALRPYAQEAGLTLLHERHFKFAESSTPPRPLPWTLLPLHYPMLQITHYARLERALPIQIFRTGFFRSTLPPAPRTAEALASIPRGNLIVIDGRLDGIRAITTILPFGTRELAGDGRSFVALQALR